jgi:hypothetical protein
MLLDDSFETLLAVSSSSKIVRSDELKGQERSRPGFIIVHNEDTRLILDRRVVRCSILECFFVCHEVALENPKREAENNCSIVLYS